MLDLISFGATIPFSCWLWRTSAGDRTAFQMHAMQIDSLRYDFYELLMNL